MNANLLLSALFAATVATATTAQTHTVRGSIENVQGTTNQFFLDCTNLRLTSSALNLNLWMGPNLALEVVDIGTPGAPLLDVRSATPTNAAMDMGNLRAGRSDRWQVRAPAGSLAFVLFDLTANTSFRPMAPYGTFLLGNGAQTLASGTTNALGVWEFSVAIPASAAPFVGTAVTSQALLLGGGTAWFSEPDCKTLQ